MDILSIYTVTRSLGGYYGLCKKTVTKERMIIVYCEYGCFILLNDKAVLVGEQHANWVNQGGVKHEMDVKITSSAMARLIKL